MKPYLQSLLALVLILLVMPSVAKACVAINTDGLVIIEEKKFFKLEDTLYPVAQKNEYLYQRFPNILIARLDRVTDVNGKKFKDGNYSFPVIYHYDVELLIKGDLGKRFQSEAMSGWSYVCGGNIRRGERWLMFLPEIPESKKYKHSEIVYGGNHSAPVERSADLIKWLTDKAIESGHPPRVIEPDVVSDPILNACPEAFTDPPDCQPPEKFFGR